MLKKESLFSSPHANTFRHNAVRVPSIPTMEDIRDLLTQFPSFPLEKAASINLNARFDAKFLLPVSLLTEELKWLREKFMVQLNSQQAPISHYSTRYWDSVHYSYFKHHATSRSKRIKVRKRSYVDTGECFLEIKKKKYDQTVKIRMPSEFSDTFLESDKRFLISQGIDPETIHPVLDVQYRRCTLWDIHKQGRITIDLDYEVSREGRVATYPGVAILEIKGSRKYINQTAKQFQIPIHRFRTGFSKYGMGIIQLNQFNASDAKDLYKTFKRLIKLNDNI